MAYTQADLDRLQSAIAKGAQSVEMNGEKVNFRTYDEMLRLERKLKTALGSLGGSRRIHNPTTRTGFR
ncbi:phage head-tail joining protein [Parasedimentitalea huanghaiensis]|uniref:GpW protein n=1 Tax=Parasedimentitalea huanghaiensis TaxID=2682100 RepID=A0A6L6WFM4_9RHOB|nr:hypothetical protein [Zongyanglinia huanghaiensis]MVO14817.1 hypothetical protein [Zongyanglinia huanghaiensis]